MRRSGLPFFTVAITIEPVDAPGRRLRREPQRLTAITYRFLAPVLSAQFITAPTGHAMDILYLVPEAAPPPAYR